MLPLLLISLLLGSIQVAAAEESTTSITAACDAEADLLRANSSITINAEGTVATATLTNLSTTCTYQVGLASYKVFGLNAAGEPRIRDQVIFDYETLDIGETATLTVALPPCKAQIDLFYGEVLLERPFYHSEGRLIRSMFTDAPFCTEQSCTYTQGFWKNHPADWPVTSLKLGTVTYTQEQLLAILNTPVRGNGLISLSHQLIAAKLNVASGTDDAAVLSSIQAADALIGGLVIAPIGSGYLKPSATSRLTTALDNYNNGVTGPGHCG